MKNQNQLQDNSMPLESLVKPVLLGTGIALVVICFFIFGVDEPHPEWGTFWRLRPLIITPLAGAVGGAFYAFMDYQASRGFNRTGAVVISIIVYCIGLWLGIILGLDGTMWN
jgi:hypothetical protein